MTAKEFIKQYGWEVAKEYLSGVTVYDNHLMVFTDDNDLKQLVDAWELVEKYGGLDESKYIIRLIEGNVFVKDNIKRDHTINDFKQAIKLVESVNENTVDN